MLARVQRIQLGNDISVNGLCQITSLHNVDRFMYCIYWTKIEGHVNDKLKYTVKISLRKSSAWNNRKQYRWAAVVIARILQNIYSKDVEEEEEEL